MKLAQVLLAIPTLVTAPAIPGLQERAPTDEALNSTAADIQARQGAPCVIRTHWQSSWKEGAYQRRRVKATAERTGGPFPNTYSMVHAWVEKMKGLAHYDSHDYGHGIIVNPQYWFEGNNVAYADISTFIGTNGHKIYTNFHQTAVNSWRAESQFECDVDSKF